MSAVETHTSNSNFMTMAVAKNFLFNTAVPKDFFSGVHGCQCIVSSR